MNNTFKKYTKYKRNAPNIKNMMDDDDMFSVNITLKYYKQISKNMKY